ncbi:MAG: hypothetical protein Q9160_004441 [Pyrenula sp. 1 TL-2023]
MLEAREGYAVLKDIDPDTFVRFCEYAYKGDYTVARPDDIIVRAEGLSLDEVDVSHVTAVDEIPEVLAEATEPVPEEEPLAVPEPSRSPFGERSIALGDDGISNLTTRRSEAASLGNDIWDSFRKSKKGKKARKAKTAKTRRKRIDDLAKSKETLQSASPDARAWKRVRFWRAFTDDEDSTPPRYACDDEGNNERESWSDYTPVFLAHARVYAFADTYAIPGLARLAVQHLRDALIDLKLGTHDQSQLQGVLELLDYTYSHTADRSEGGKIDILRDLVVHYTSCVVEYLEEDSEFLKILEKNGQVGRDLVTYMMRRLA